MMSLLSLSLFNFASNFILSKINIGIYNTLVFKRKLESSYVCLGSPHIQQKNRNIRNNVIYIAENIFIITLTTIRVSWNGLLNFFSGSILLRDG